jgi:hypothetical protein
LELTRYLAVDRLFGSRRKFTIRHVATAKDLFESACKYQVKSVHKSEIPLTLNTPGIPKKFRKTRTPDSRSIAGRMSQPFRTSSDDIVMRAGVCVCVGGGRGFGVLIV